MVGHTLILISRFYFEAVSIFSTNQATDLKRIVAVRYLGGMLELPTLWDYHMQNPYSFVENLCKLSTRLLTDLATEQGLQDAVSLQELVTADTEGINLFLFAFLDGLHARLWALMPHMRKTVRHDDFRSPDVLRQINNLILELYRYSRYFWFWESYNPFPLLL